MRDVDVVQAIATSFEFLRNLTEICTDRNIIAAYLSDIIYAVQARILGSCAFQWIQSSASQPTSLAPSPDSSRPRDEKSTRNRFSYFWWICTCSGFYIHQRCLALWWIHFLGFLYTPDSSLFRYPPILSGVPAENSSLEFWFLVDRG